MQMALPPGLSLEVLALELSTAHSHLDVQSLLHSKPRKAAGAEADRGDLPVLSSLSHELCLSKPILSLNVPVQKRSKWFIRACSDVKFSY